MTTSGLLPPLLQLCLWDQAEVGLSASECPATSSQTGCCDRRRQRSIERARDRAGRCPGYRVGPFRHVRIPGHLARLTDPPRPQATTREPANTVGGRLRPTSITGTARQVRFVSRVWWPAQESGQCCAFLPSGLPQPVQAEGCSTSSAGLPGPLPRSVGSGLSPWKFRLCRGSLHETLGCRCPLQWTPPVACAVAPVDVVSSRSGPSRASFNHLSNMI